MFWFINKIGISPKKNRHEKSFNFLKNGESIIYQKYLMNYNNSYTLIKIFQIFDLFNNESSE